MIALLQTSQDFSWISRVGSSTIGSEPTFKFWVLQPYMSKLLATLVYQEVFYQTLLLTSVTESLWNIVLWDKDIFYQCCLQPNALTKHQGCQIFFVAYGQRPDKNGQNGFKVMAKITKCFNYGNFHIHRCLKLFGKQYAFCQKMWFCQRSNFLP